MQTQNTQGAPQLEKDAPEVIEKHEFFEKPDAEIQGDHTGAVAKTDPEEIRLVRKIDWRLMVSEI